MKPSTMESGRRMSGKAMAHIIIRTEIDTKEIGAMTFKAELVRTTILTEIFTKASGSMENRMGKAIIFIMVIRECIKATGRMAKNKDSEN